MSEGASTLERLKHAWNVFKNKDPVQEGPMGGNYVINPGNYGYGFSTYNRPDRIHPRSTDRTIATAIYNRLATDCVCAKFEHVRVDDNDRYLESMKSGLNNILTVEANIDQSSMDFFLDLVMSMLDEGCVAAVPVDTTINPSLSGSFDIQTMRVGKIITWYPKDVQVELYNEDLGRRVPVTVPKRTTAIISNPFYSVMNEPNSVLKKLLAKLALLDVVDNNAASGKMDLIVQLPYLVKSKTKQEQAESRRAMLEDQLANSKYGIGYIDGTERVIQLNRPVENNLMPEIEYLTSMLYSQLGITEDIMNGTASEEVMQNYYKRTINVILDAIVKEFERKFLTKTARSQNQAIRYYRDPFALTPTTAIADIADKFTRNEILAPNEMRSVVGFKPVSDSKADELRNRNLNEAVEGSKPPNVRDSSENLNQNEGEKHEV